MKKDISELNISGILKSIHHECLGCQSQLEIKIANCDNIYCAFHTYIPYIIDVEESQTNTEQLKELAKSELRATKLIKKKNKDKEDTTPRKKDIPPKKQKKGDKV